MAISLLPNLPTSTLVDEKYYITRAWQLFLATQFAKQTALPSGVPVPITGSTNAAPFGYTTAAQADRIVTLVNSMQAALISSGIMT